MRGREEATLRLATRRRAELGGLSDEAFDELVQAVKANPDSFVSTNEDRAYLMLVDAVDKNLAVRVEEEFLDEVAFERSRARRTERLRRACDEVLALDPGCLDATTILALLRDNDAEGILATLMDEQRKLGEFAAAPAGAAEGATAWDDVFARPQLRLRATVTRMLLETGRFRPAAKACEELVNLMPHDPLGARFTWALALARLEDEEGFNELDARFGRQGNAWSHLARTLLMFKLDRLPAARRALKGYAELCEGGAYILLRPILADAYLPDRPQFKPGSFDEALLAVHEADPVVVDTPDFINWASEQPGFSDQAQRYAEANGFDW